MQLFSPGGSGWMRIGSRSLLIVALAALAVPAAIAQPWSGWTTPAAGPSRYTPADARALRTGQYRWSPYPNDLRPVRVAVDLVAQRAYVFQGDALVGISTVSTGRRGHETPAGAFPILQKQSFHRSNLYSNAPMPFMQRLTWGGVALHAGHVPRTRASHGCIRLPYGFAHGLFGLTRVGAMVVVSHGLDTSLPAPPRPQFVDDLHIPTTEESVVAISALI